MKSSGEDGGMAEGAEKLEEEFLIWESIEWVHHELNRW